MSAAASKSAKCCTSEIPLDVYMLPRWHWHGSPGLVLNHTRLDNENFRKTANSQFLENVSAN